MINTEQRVLHKAGKALPLLEGTNQQHRPLVSTVRTQETVTIPPFSELEIQVATPDTINNSIDWLLEALPYKDTITVVTAVVTPHNGGHSTIVPMRIANISGEAVTIIRFPK